MTSPTTVVRTGRAEAAAPPVDPPRARESTKRDGHVRSLFLAVLLLTQLAWLTALVYGAYRLLTSA